MRSRPVVIYSDDIPEAWLRKLTGVSRDARVDSRVDAVNRRNKRPLRRKPAPPKGDADA